ncbi:glycosyltransferase family 2 protein [Methyloradius palustris]|uniref:Glycosyltransferase 2-like domain-containing protein n=1 Tax=Methyloradius palustris TaxID=2778876 RepID=A0A8D5G3D4_9PROT|nr:glycosyltransferase family A protein [Methyloradius palustris]BCM25283.1 hypothetical protein ZMTM_15420 [Methyloradius palustris]
MTEIALSFCIPTYNRAQSVYALVINILSCSDADIEVVVLDNCSTDDTLTILKSINDERLLLFSNEKNMGGLYNGLNVLNKARGKYLVFSTDKDNLIANQITKFKSFLLQHTNISCGFCELNSLNKSLPEIFSKGILAIKNVAYKGNHPTGYFFKNEFLKLINHTERFSDFRFVDVFALDFIFAELCTLGDGAIYHNKVFITETAEVAAKHKSYNASGKSKEAFYSPEGRLKVALNYTTHINSLALRRQEKDMLVIDVFTRNILAATFGYKALMENKYLCLHYDMESRDVYLAELLSIGLYFYKDFSRKNLYFSGNYSIRKLIFDAHISFSILRIVLGTIRARLFRFPIN